MAKKIIVFVLFGLMVLGVAIAIVNFTSNDVDAIPCRPVKYHEDPVDCSGDGNDCMDCTTPKPPKDK